MDEMTSIERDPPARVSKAFLVLLFLVIASSFLFYSEASRNQLLGSFSDADFADVELVGVYMDSLSSSPVVYLLEPKEEVYLPIWIGSSEAIAIQSEIAGVKPPRPLTNDLLRSVIESLGATVERVKITKVQDDTYYAILSLKRGGDDETIEVDARPSDAIGLAIRFKCPIQVHRDVLNAYGVSSNSKKQQKEKIRKS